MARASKRRGAVTPRAKIWLEVDGEYVFGLGICRILEAIDETGSIKRAAAAIGKSYRHVWSRVKEAEAAIGFPLVATQVGGSEARRSSLTEPARQLAASYRELREQVFALVDEQYAASMQQIVDDAVKSAAAK
jgi:molybdate transport system regulatory protein